MKSQVLSLVVILCLGQAMSDKNIDSVKEEAYNTVETVMQNLQKFVNEILIQIPKKQSNLYQITGHEKNVASGYVQHTFFNIRKTSASAYIAKELLETTNEVPKCIDYVANIEENELADYHRYQLLPYMDGRESEYDLVQKAIVTKWNGDYNASMHSFSQVYDMTMENIYASYDVQEIKFIVQNFVNTSIRLKIFMRTIIVDLNKTQLKFLEHLDFTVNNYKTALRVKVDSVEKEIWDCLNIKGSEDQKKI